MSNINFRPWVGEQYLSEGFKGKRILVLGESHYCDELSEGSRCYPLCKKANMRKDCFSQTEDRTRENLYEYMGYRYQQTSLCFERAVAGKELSMDEREEFWQGIIFYNYIQHAMSGPRVAPQPEHWVKSELAFKEILEQYLPDYIIVWGVRLYNSLPAWDGVESKLYVNENDSTDIWTYTIKGKPIPAMKVHHPSAPTGKNWSYWHEFYKKFLQIE